MTIREHFVDENDAKNTFHLVKTQDCEAILNTMKELPDHMRYTGNSQHTHRYVGTVPIIIAVQWAREWGVKLYSREWQEKTSSRLKTDPNWKGLRAPQLYRY